ncbi:hypothetical protein GGS20DRAFT_545258 [Poronia punctata]|nr:hypothetical protein GGS20DRAFT_545258 [Poronia punctata]
MMSPFPRDIDPKDICYFKTHSPQLEFRLGILRSFTKEKHLLLLHTMCIEIQMRFEECGHDEYQNTHGCTTVKRGKPGDDQLLEKTVHLPATRPRLPPGLICESHRAIRPVKGKCSACRVRESSAHT